MREIVNEVEGIKQELYDKKLSGSEDTINRLSALSQKIEDFAAEFVHVPAAAAETAAPETKTITAPAPGLPLYSHDEIIDDSHRLTDVLTDGYVGPGGAHHHYLIAPKEVGQFEPLEVLFQDGPIKEAGVNGVMDENLLAIVIDRLQGFQSGPYACEFNAIALEHIKAGLAELQARTKERVDRGVEGTHAK